MKRSRRRYLPLAASALGAAFAIALTGTQAAAQSDRTIKIVVPFPPGGAIDVLARMMADQIGKAHGPAVVIEDRPGGGTVIGTEAVFRANPDGNTLLMDNNSFVLTPHLNKVAYDPFTGFEPICNIASTPAVIAVNNASPYYTLAELFDAARAKPGVLTYGSAPASALNVGFERLSRLANFQMTFVPFGGTPPAVTAVLGGHITVAHVDYPSAAGQIQAGALRALAVESRQRIEALPNVPTVAESGYKDFSLDLWYGMFAPAKTPKNIISQLAGWFGEFVQTPEVKSKMAALAISPALSCGADYTADLRKQYEDYGRAIRDAGIKPE